KVATIVKPSKHKMKNGICCLNACNNDEASTPTPIVISPFTLIGTKKSKKPMSDGSRNFHALFFVISVSLLLNVVIVVIPFRKACLQHALFLIHTVLVMLFLTY